MRRPRIIWVVAGGLVAVLVAWVAQNTSWVDTTVPMPLKGEARDNPFYAVQRFAEALGARTAWDRALVAPSREAVMVLSGWHWSLSSARRGAVERWVESGGRLVVDGTLVGEEQFERWSGIVRERRELDEDELDEWNPDDSCGTVEERYDGAPASSTQVTAFRMCDLRPWSSLSTRRPVAWTLRDKTGIQAMRVRVGRGSVTFINAAPFRYRSLFDGDHGRLFVAATQLRRGDEVHFLSEDDHPSLLALLWRHGAPVVVLTVSAIALLLWRGAVRFGPLAAQSSSARRSLAEQIRGTGQFALRHGSGESLHQAVVRALHEAAQRRVPGYARLADPDRAAALARLTGYEADVLTSALYNPALRRPQQLHSTIALLESARRRMALDHTRSSHGTY